MVAELPVGVPTSGPLPVLLGRVLGDLEEGEQEAVRGEPLFVVLNESPAGSLPSFDAGDVARATAELTGHLCDGDPGQLA